MAAIGIGAIWKADANGKAYRDTRSEDMEAGRMYHLLKAVNANTDKLKETFPSLDLSVVLNKPYVHVTIRAQPRYKLAPLDSPAVLESEDFTHDMAYFEDPIDGYPSDLLITKLSLIA